MIEPPVNSWARAAAVTAAPMLVSIIIDNHNYAAYLPCAIDSALAQTYPACEVIVVDDGSTDHSRSIIASYGNAVRVVLQECGGQASAFNAGFDVAHGAIVIFLDADDQLLPNVVADVVAVFAADPSTAKVQFRLQLIDGQGNFTGATLPPWQVPLPEGDLRREVLRFPDDLVWLPTSGNAFATRSLRRILPVPETVYTICADYYLSNMVPLTGTIHGLTRAGGLYRVHGQNRDFRPGLDLHQTRRTIQLSAATHRAIRGFVADATGVPVGEWPILSLTYIAHRCISLKLEPEYHPCPGDTRARLWGMAMVAILTRRDLGLAIRALYILWFAAIFVAPRSGVRRLAGALFNRSLRGRINELLALLAPPRQSPSAALARK